MLGRHIGERSIALDLGCKPVCTFEFAAKQSFEGIGSRQSDANAETLFRSGVAIQVVRMADFHGPCQLQSRGAYSSPDR